MNAELFVELRCEELPARMVGPAIEGLAAGLVALLEGVPHGAVRTWATPRRLAVAIADVASERPSMTAEVLGPPADKAFDAEGRPTAVGAGFARGKGVDPSSLYAVELPKRGKVAAVRVTTGGERTADRVADGLARVISGIPFAKSMTWGDGTLAFGRPLHGVVAVLGGEGIRGEAHGIAFGTTTWGHRLAPEPLVVTDSAAWEAGLRARLVEPDVATRRSRIQALLAEATAELGADPITDDALLAEVTNLVEWPTRILGTFDAELLGLPARLLVTSMKVNQRYFPVFVDGRLTNRFVIVANNPHADPEVVAEGNARVLRARFHDARFFFAEDTRKSLDSHGAKLASMRWIRGLGTMADKPRRLAVLGSALADWTGADPAVVRRAAELSKADLVTLMVGEFPELQGHMGRLYAATQGEPPGVPAAIEEHWQPKGAEDAVAASAAGAALALAERLDTLVGCFGIGLAPTSGGDPQGLRRAAVGIVRTVLHHGLRGPLAPWIDLAIATFHDHARGEGFEAWTKARGQGPEPVEAGALRGALLEFVVARFEAQKVAEGLSADVVAAVTSTVEASDVDLAVLDAKLQALARASGTPDFPAILTTFKRVLNITGAAADAVPAAEACREAVELDLRSALEAARGRIDEAERRLAFGDALAAALALRGPVEAFFDGVLVNDPDPVVRAVRVGLLVGVAAQFRRVADLSRISTR